MNVAFLLVTMFQIHGSSDKTMCVVEVSFLSRADACSYALLDPGSLKEQFNRNENSVIT